MNYFHYFSEIEERFSRRRGSLLLLSTLDWALIETWREAGIPLEAVLRGIDEAFDKHDAKLLRAKGRTRKVNGLAWCSQAVMQAAEDMAEATTGSAKTQQHESAESGFEAERVARFLQENAKAIEATALTASAASSVLVETARRLGELAEAMRGTDPTPLDELDRTLTVLEEKLFAAIMSTASETELVNLRELADRELAPYRAKMSAVQIRQIQTQFLQKRLLEARSLPRLSLFYMGHE
jgi:protein required for attachment to host cells